MSKQVKSRKIDSLQSLRGIAFLSILSLHAGCIPAGAWGVSIFFVLSGFLMAYTYYDRQMDSSFGGCLKFSLKKIKKLYLLHMLMFVITIPLVLVKLFSDYSLNKAISTALYAVLNVFLLQSWIPNSEAYYSFNGVAWYLSVCILLYALFPIIIKYIRKESNKSLLLAVVIYLIQILLAYLTRFVPSFPFSDNFSKWFGYIFPLFRVGDFAIGCCFGTIILKKDFVISSAKASVMEMFTAVLILIQLYIYIRQFGFFGEDWFRFSLLFTVTSVATVLLFFEERGYITKLLTCKPLVYLGNISANAFLIHQVIIKYIDFIFKYLFGYSANRYLKFFITLFVILLGNLIYERKSKRKSLCSGV